MEVFRQVSNWHTLAQSGPEQLHVCDSLKAFSEGLPRTVSHLQQYRHMDSSLIDDIYGTDAFVVELPKQEENRLRALCTTLEADKVALQKKLDVQLQRNAILERNLSAVYSTAKKELAAKDMLVQQLMKRLSDADGDERADGTSKRSRTTSSNPV